MLNSTGIIQGVFLSTSLCCQTTCTPRATPWIPKLPFCPRRESPPKCLQANMVTWYVVFQTIQVGRSIPKQNSWPMALLLASKIWKKNRYLVTAQIRNGSQLRCQNDMFLQLFQSKNPDTLWIQNLHILMLSLGTKGWPWRCEMVGWLQPTHFVDSWDTSGTQLPG